MIAKTEALVLRVSPFSRTSHVVRWLTPEHGQLTTTIKGAQRPKSAFLGQYDLFYTCELVYYLRDRNGLHVAKECSPLVTRDAFRTKWRACAGASYVCGMASRVGVSGEHQHELYVLTTTVLDALCRSGSSRKLLFWFEMRLADVLGFSPRLDTCVRCGKPVDRQTPLVFSAGLGGVLCPTCDHGAASGDVRLHPRALALLRHLREAEEPVSVVSTDCSEDQLFALREVLGVFLTYHIDVSPESRRIAMELASH